MRVDLESCQDIELLRREAFRMERVIESLVEERADPPVILKHSDEEFERNMYAKIAELESKINVLEDEIQYNDSECPINWLTV